MFYNVVNQYYSINLHRFTLMKCNIHIHKVNVLFDFGKINPYIMCFQYYLLISMLFFTEGEV